MMGPVVWGVSHFSPVAATPNFRFVLQICISCGSIKDPGTQRTCKCFREWRSGCAPTLRVIFRVVMHVMVWARTGCLCEHCEVSIFGVTTFCQIVYPNYCNSDPDLSYLTDDLSRCNLSSKLMLRLRIHILITSAACTVRKSYLQRESSSVP